jgi:MtfA peptidase
MIFAWFKRRRRKKLLQSIFPVEWIDYLNKNVALYSLLTESEQIKLRNDLRILVAEKNWEGCGGLLITDEIKVTISAQAALLLLGIQHDYYDRVRSILVYPSGYRSSEGWIGPDGVVYFDVGTLGEAWYDGPVVLAWDMVLEGGRNPRDGRNLVMHEFAHQLDYLDGLVDGTPILRDQEQYQKWHEVMNFEYGKLQIAAEYNKPTVLDTYGATNPAEFFAVSTEAFFEKPIQLQEKHPDLYNLLKDYYGQDAAERFSKEKIGPTSESMVHPKKLKYRRSRAPGKIQKHLEVALTWPSWVRWWDLHPGQPRSNMIEFVDNQITVAFGMFFFFVLDLLFTLHFWTTPKIMFLLMFTYFLVSAIWLRLAIRWVDRNGEWAGNRPRTTSRLSKSLEEKRTEPNPSPTNE